jgi:hypothetical protein
MADTACVKASEGERMVASDKSHRRLLKAAESSRNDAAITYCV